MSEKGGFGEPSLLFGEIHGNAKCTKIGRTPTPPLFAAWSRSGSQRKRHKREVVKSPGILGGRRGLAKEKLKDRDSKN